MRPGEGGTVAELREQVVGLERRAERLREDALRAMIGEKREQEEKAKLSEQLRRQADQAASAREELTVEAVGLQRELEKAYVVEKTLRAELADAQGQLASREAFVNDFDAKVRLLESRLGEKDFDLATSATQMEALRKELSEAQALSAAVRERLEAHKRTEGLLHDQRREAADESKTALAEVRQLQIELEREQAARKQAEENEAYLVKENAQLEGLVKEMTATADRLALENEKLSLAVDQNKMVSVVGRFMIRKFHGKLLGVQQAHSRMEASQAELHAKLVRSQQKSDAIDVEFAKV